MPNACDYPFTPGRTYFVNSPREDSTGCYITVLLTSDCATGLLLHGPIVMNAEGIWPTVVMEYDPKAMYAQYILYPTDTVVELPIPALA